MPIPYVDHLLRNGELFRAAAAKDIDAHVPSCPEWNVGKLTTHLGLHHRWVAESVSGGGEPPGDPAKPGLRGEELLEWFDEGYRALASLLEETPDDTPAWTWYPENQTVGFWRRRTSLETLVHRWDAENATMPGTTTPFDVELAADCVNEMLTVFVTSAGDGGIYRGPDQVVHFVLTDHPDRYTMAMTTGSLPEITPGSDGDPDVKVSGSAEATALMLWGRRDLIGLEIDGSAQLASQLSTWLTS